MDLAGIILRAQSAPLTVDDAGKLTGALATLSFLTQDLERKGTSIERLRRMLFGASTEKAKDILPTLTPAAAPPNADAAAPTSCVARASTFVGTVRGAS